VKLSLGCSQSLTLLTVGKVNFLVKYDLSDNPHNQDYRTNHETSMTVLNQLINIMYKYFIECHVGDVQFLITSCP